MYNYIETPNSNLICCICRAAFTDPVTTRTCSHTFCRECILVALEHAAVCPVDRRPLKEEDIGAADMIVRSMVDELLVECVHAGEGCGYTGQRQGMAVHLKDECEYGQVVCAVEGCGESMQRRELKGHVHGEDADEEKEEEEEEEEEEEKTEAEESLRKIGMLTEQNVLLRHRVESLESTLHALKQEMAVLRSEVGGLAAGVDNVHRRGEMALANETLRMGEEFMSIRAQMHGLRMQMHGLMMERHTAAATVTKL